MVGIGRPIGDVEDPTNLSGGTYDVDITDAQGCITSITGIILVGPVVTLTSSDADNLHR